MDETINRETETQEEAADKLMHDLLGTEADPAEERAAEETPEEPEAAAAAAVEAAAVKAAEAEPPAVPVEAFVPTDYYQRSKKARREKGGRKRKRSFLWMLLVLVGGALLVAGGVFAFKLLNNPGSFFKAGNVTVSAATPAPTATADTTPAPDSTPTPVPTPTATPDPYTQLVAEGAAGTALAKKIVNVLMIGVDYAEERETWGGKHAYHADVMMLLAINFDENRVDLISLPRDTYANIPGVKGIYKLNASLDCGGGMDAPDGAGYLKTCEAASWMLGGIPVDYYYAVTMPAVKQLVDAVGGVDYELEVSYTMMGRRYRKGEQHLDGQGVLDYLRVRKNISEAGDWNRVNRQKKMMVALFESMQQQNLILKIPDILASFNGQLFTNCTGAQTAALARVAYGLDKENIGMYSMGGTMKNIFNWNFCITDQAKRVEIIKAVYGIDVPEEKEYNMSYAQYRWADMRADAFLEKAPGLARHVREAIEADDALPSYDSYYGDFGGGVSDGGGGTGGGSVGGVIIDGEVIDGGSTGDGSLGGGDPMGGGAVIVGYIGRIGSGVLRQEYQQYSGEDRDLYASFLNSVDDVEETRKRAYREVEKYLAGQENSFKSASASYASAVNSLGDLGNTLASRFGYSASFKFYYEKDKSFNEITVDFN